MKSPHMSGLRILLLWATTYLRQVESVSVMEGMKTSVVLSHLHSYPSLSKLTLLIRPSHRVLPICPNHLMLSQPCRSNQLLPVLLLKMMSRASSPIGPHTPCSLKYRLGLWPDKSN